MYFSVPLSDSHSSESGSRLFAIRSRIYNSASPDLLSRGLGPLHTPKGTQKYIIASLNRPRPNIDT